MKNKLMIIIKSILFGSLLLTLVVYIVKSIIECISTYNSAFTSFPWYTPFLFNGMILAIPILIELISIGVYYLIVYKIKKNN